MKRRTKRRIQRFFSSIGNIIALVLTVLGSFGIPFLYSKLASHIGSFLTLSVVVCFPVVMSVTLIILYNRTSIAEKEYFEDITHLFRTQVRKSTKDAVEGILNSEKVRPHYVHVAPKCIEMEMVYERLHKEGFACIVGGPGEGKSMLAYHIAHRFQKEDNFYIYELMVERLLENTNQDPFAELRHQLDKIKGKKSLIIVDDAHKLSSSKRLYIELRKEAIENRGIYIWIETELHGEEAIRKGSISDIRINFKNFFAKLVKDFYQSDRPEIQRYLKNRIPGLEEAIEMVNERKICDAWLFAFIASRGEERLIKDLEALGDYKALILFFISAATVLSGEIDMEKKQLINYLSTLSGKPDMSWFNYEANKVPFHHAIKSLQEQTKKRKSLIRIRSGVYISSLHYRFARVVIRVLLDEMKDLKDLSKYLLMSIEQVLTSKYERCLYYGILHRDLGTYAAEFDHRNKDWLVEFLSNPITEKLHCYPRTLGAINAVSKCEYSELYNEIVKSLDIESIADIVSGANGVKVDKFYALAAFMNLLKNRKNDLIKEIEATGFKHLIEAARNAEVKNFQGIALLLSAFGDRRTKLTDTFDLEELADKICGAEIEQFSQIEAFMIALDEKEKEVIKYTSSAMGKKRKELIGIFNHKHYKQLAEKAQQVDAMQFKQLAHLLNAFGTHRDRLIGELDLKNIADKISVARTEHFQRVADVLNAFGTHRNQLIGELDLKDIADKISNVKSEHFQKAADLLNAFGDRKDDLIKEIDEEGYVKLARAADEIKASQFEQFGNLLQVLEERRKELSNRLNYDSIARIANVIDPLNISELGGLTNFISHLEDLDREELIPKVNWLSISKKCPINAKFLPTMGKCLMNLAKILNNDNELIGSSAHNDIANHLKNNVSDLKQSIVDVNPGEYYGLAAFLWSCGQIVPPLMYEVVDSETIENIASNFTVVPGTYVGVAELIKELHLIDPKKSKSFIKHDNIRGKIIRSIKDQHWIEGDVEHLKHLIKVIYKSDRKIWMDLYDWFIKIDPSLLDLAALYKEIDEGEKSDEEEENASP